MAYCLVNYIYHVVHFILSIDLSHNCKFVPFDHLHLIPSSSAHSFDNHKSGLFFLWVCLFLKYSWPIVLCDFLLHSIVVWYFYIFLNDHHDKSSYDLSPFKDINYWLYSPHCTFHTCDSFILQLNVCIS